ncbi:MAG: DUF1684 domain-containing protein, partial [Owenweeksia sp.]
MRLLLILLLFPLIGFPQDSTNSYLNTIIEYQEKLNAEFADPQQSPLTKKDLKKFKGLPFYPIDSTYRVQAKFIRTENAEPFEMATSTERRPVYEKFGEARFQLNGQPLVLSIYQSHRLKAMEEYKNHLFLPFNDLTNGDGTYGGGRFIDLEIPEDSIIIIDFNKAYNPLCAYNGKYS